MNKYLFRTVTLDNNGGIIGGAFDKGYSYEKPFYIGDKMVSKPATESSDDDMLDESQQKGILLHKNKIYTPMGNWHYGYSTIGKESPKHSLYNIADFDYLFPNDTDALKRKASLEKYTKAIPESAHDSQILKSYYADNEKNDYEYLTNNLYSFAEKLEGLLKLQKKRASVDDISNAKVTFSNNDFDFDSDDIWDNLVDNIDFEGITGARAFTNKDGKRILTHESPYDLGNERIMLVAAPEDKILTADDVVAKGLTTQRDFENELIASELTPVADITSGYLGALKKYNEARNKGATGKEAFNDAFKLSPSEIESDATKKYIYKDLSSWYNNQNRSSNILSGIKELGQ